MHMYAYTYVYIYICIYTYAAVLVARDFKPIRHGGCAASPPVGASNVGRIISCGIDYVMRL